MQAVLDGVVPESDIDDKVARIMRLARRLGALAAPDGQEAVTITGESAAGDGGLVPAGNGGPVPDGKPVLDGGPLLDGGPSWTVARPRTGDRPGTGPS